MPTVTLPPNALRHLARAVAAGVAAATLAAPAATARIDPPTTLDFNTGGAAPTATVGSGSRPANPPVVIVRNVDDGFDWGAAAIGAGGAGALVAVVSLAALAQAARGHTRVAP
jgi:hypothetical protein